MGLTSLWPGMNTNLSTNSITYEFTDSNLNTFTNVMKVSRLVS